MSELKDIELSVAPINEVVFGVIFDAPKFSPVHFGLFWNEINIDYPLQSQQIPVLSNEELSQNAGFPAFQDIPNCRVWYESADKKKLIQLQSNRFHYNWRKLHNDDEYPRCKYLLPKFISEYNRFCKWASTVTPEIELNQKSYELSYINHYSSDLGWNGLNDTSSVINLIDVSKKSDFTPQFISSNFSYKLEKNIGNFVLMVNQGVKRESGEPVLVVNMTVSKNRVETDELEDWFKMAHNKIIEMFCNMTPEKTLNSWRK